MPTPDNNSANLSFQEINKLSRRKTYLELFCRSYQKTLRSQITREYYRVQISDEILNDLIATSSEISSEIYKNVDFGDILYRGEIMSYRYQPVYLDSERSIYVDKNQIKQTYESELRSFLIGNKYHNSFADYNKYVSIFNEIKNTYSNVIIDRGATESKFSHAFAESILDVLWQIIKDYNSPKKQILEQINASAETAPIFEAVGDAIKFTQRNSVDRSTKGRKKALDECFQDLKEISERKRNEQPILANLVTKYGSALEEVLSDGGAYALFMAGQKIEMLIKVKASSPFDGDHNIPLDIELSLATSALIMAHAGFVMLFPDVVQASQEFEKYSEQTEIIDAFRDRLLDPLLDRLAEAREMLEQKTLEITQSIKEVDDFERNLDRAPSKVITSAKFLWLRGAMAGIGKYVIDRVRPVVKISRDHIIGGTAHDLIKHTLDGSPLSKAVMSFLNASHSTLLKIADTFQSAFGWIRSLLAYIGLL